MEVGAAKPALLGKVHHRLRMLAVADEVLATAGKAGGRPTLTIRKPPAVALRGGWFCLFGHGGTDQVVSPSFDVWLR